MGSEQVKELRQFFDNKKITQKMIAEKLNIGPAYINKLLTGKKSFGKQMAKQFQDLYGLSQSWLLTGEGTMLTAPVSVANGDHSSQAVGDGATANNSDGVEECLDIIRRQQDSIEKLVNTVAELTRQAAAPQEDK